jgi:uncharacterized protein (TIGR02246 family)
MRTVLSVVLVLALVPLAACAPNVNNPADVQAIKEASLAWDKAWESGNAEFLVSRFYTPDAVTMAPNQPASVGQQAIRAASQKYFDRYTEETRGILEDVRVSGDLAVARGTSEGTSTPKAGGASARYKEKFLTAFQRQADGSWKAFWDIYNSDLPAPGTTADDAEEQAIVQLERDWAMAMQKRDAAALDRILAKEWTETVNGEVMTRAQALAGLKSDDLRMESVELRDLSVHVFGDAALATMTAVIKGTQKGKDISGSERSTDFFVKRDGRWQAAGTQNTAIKP